MPTAAPQEPLSALLERMAPVGPRSRALVIDGRGVIGIVTPSDVARLIDVYRLAQPGLALTAPGRSSEKYSDAG